MIPLHERWKEGLSQELSEDNLGGKGLAHLIHYMARNHLQVTPNKFFMPSVTFVLPTSYNLFFQSANQLEGVTKRARGSVGNAYPEIVEAYWHAKQDLGLKRALEEILDGIDGPLAIRSSSTLEYGKVIDGRVMLVAGGYLTYIYHNDRTRFSLQERIEHVYRMIINILADNENPVAHEIVSSFGVGYDSKMAVEIQPLVCQQIAPGIIAPIAAGVIHTYNPIIMGDITHDEGMIRLVLGLGTRAVDPMYVHKSSLKKPGKGMKFEGIDELVACSQEGLDIVDHDFVPRLEDFQARRLNRGFREIRLDDLLKGNWDEETTRQIRRTLYGSYQVPIGDKLYQTIQGISGERPVVTFHEWIKQIGTIVNKVTSKVSKLSTEYRGCDEEEREFEIGILKSGNEFQLYLLQERLLAFRNYRATRLPKTTPPEHRIILKTEDYAVECVDERISHVVYITPAYFDLPQSTETGLSPERSEVARIIGALDRNFREKNIKYALIGPGRWGNRVGLHGVPVQADFVNCSVLVGYAIRGHFPEFVGHLLTLVLAKGIYPIDFKRDIEHQDPHNFINHKLLSGLDEKNPLRNHLKDFLPDVDTRYEGVVRVIDASQISPNLIAIKGNRREGTMMYGKRPAHS